MEEFNRENRNRPQNKLLEDMFDELANIIFSREPNRIEYGEMKSREEYLERARKKFPENPKEPTSYFDEYETKTTKKKAPKVVAEQEKSPDQKEENIKESVVSKKEAEQLKNAKLEEFLKQVEEAELEEESKLVLKKMISYAKKYSDGTVKNYIPFNMRIYTDNDETLYNIINLIRDSFNYFGYMKNDQYVEKSFYLIEEINDIADLYNKQNSLVILKDVQGLLNRDTITRDKILSILETDIYGYSSIDGITTIITDKSKDVIDKLLENNLILKDKVFDFELITTTANIQDIYLKIIKTFQKDYKVTKKFGIKLLDYITETFPKSQLPGQEYAQALMEQILFNQTTAVINEKSIPKYEKNKTMEEIFADINELIGLENIKKMLKDLVSLMEFKTKTQDSLDIKNTNLHMVFLGNPGTGKTTVARMIAEILYNLKYIRKNKLLEVSAKDLIGEYVGQTAPKTNAVIKQALGGVLFIDEAYSLASKSGSNSFNEECVATLIQAMENHRDDLVVIFAGYSKEMDVFLKSNSGIASRIGYTMDFKDYTLDELILIFRSMLKKAGFIVEESAIEKAKEIIEEYRHTEGFGNARFVRNLYEKTVIKHATNTAKYSDKDKLKTIVAEDIDAENLIKFT